MIRNPAVASKRPWFQGARVTLSVFLLVLVSAWVFQLRSSEETPAEQMPLQVRPGEDESQTDGRMDNSDSLPIVGVAPAGVLKPAADEFDSPGAGVTDEPVALGVQTEGGDEDVELKVERAGVEAPESVVAIKAVRHLNITNVGDQIVITEMDAGDKASVLRRSSGFGSASMQDKGDSAYEERLDTATPRQRASAIPECPSPLPPGTGDAELSILRDQYGCQYLSSCVPSRDGFPASCTYYLSKKL